LGRATGNDLNGGLANTTFREKLGNWPDSEVIEAGKPHDQLQKLKHCNYRVATGASGEDAAQWAINKTCNN
jgi:hypothetical protein